MKGVWNVDRPSLQPDQLKSALKSIHPCNIPYMFTSITIAADLRVLIHTRPILRNTPYCCSKEHQIHSTTTSRKSLVYEQHTLSWRSRRFSQWHPASVIFLPERQFVMARFIASITNVRIATVAPSFRRSCAIPIQYTLRLYNCNLAPVDISGPRSAPRCR